MIINAKSVLNRDAIKFILKFLLTGSTICFVGCPSSFSEVEVKAAIESRGHYFFATDHSACLFLTGESHTLPKHYTKPRLVIIYNPQKNAKSILSAKAKRLYTIEIASNERSSTLSADFSLKLNAKQNQGNFIAFCIILYLLDSFKTN